jgi:RNA methyltransferase, TrmH family
MITRAQEKFIRALHTKKGRREHGFTLVEGKKPLEAAGKAVEWRFTEADTPQFATLLTTETPQEIAGVAKIPQWTTEDIAKQPVIIVLDGVQDPGNVGAILRLCAGFSASLIAVDSADISSPKVVRASVGMLFHVPWRIVSRNALEQTVQELARPVYRLEKKPDSIALGSTLIKTPCILIAGSEGGGIRTTIAGQSLEITHNSALESLNVTHALAITLWSISGLHNK